MIKAVLDTNVWLSGLFWKGKPYLIVRLAYHRKFISITSKEILNKLEEKLLAKFGFPEKETKEYIEHLMFFSVLVEPKKKHTVVSEDHSDDKIIDCAVEGEAEYIVSGDRHLLKLGEFQGIKILPPSNFLALATT